MESPRAGNNSTQSYYDFDTSIGRFRFGVQNGRIFFQKNINPRSNADEAIHYVDGKLINQAFTGEVRLDNDLTHYATKTINSATEITLADDPVIGGSAEIRLVGDGSTTPTFSADFTASATSDVYDATLAAINKVVFYYDGTDAFYSITVL